MNDVQALLARHTEPVVPRSDAFERVVRRVRLRRLRRRSLAGATVVAVIASVLVISGVTSTQPRRVALDQLIGTKSALALRADLGIDGPTKGAPDSVVVRNRTRAGKIEVSLVHVGTGVAAPVDLPADSGEISVSPKGDTVAAGSGQHVVVTSPQDPRHPAVVPDTDGARGQVSWDPGGSSLLASVGGRWVRVSSPRGSRSAGAPERLVVPSIPGGPILLSVSPAGDTVVLFGITDAGSVRLPHLFVGRFDGTVVTDPRRVEIPSSALDGPMGWVGDNAFLLAPGPARALIVRMDGSSVQVQVTGLGDPCKLTPAAACVPDGPRLLGTNADGSLLFWRLTALPRPDPDARPILVVYYKTWLNGTHAVKLSGVAGRFGPPVAPR